VDPWFLVGVAPEEAVLIRTARMVNDGKPLHVVQQIRKSAGRFREPVVACLGLSYKANVDDIRESPAVEIVAALAEQEPATTILVSDPMLSRLPASLASFPNLTLVKTQDAIAAADIVALLVDHNQFRTLSRKLLEGKVVLDTRGIWR
jgi:UDP-N-acetyl-D-mannosaminuronic acid dehydrogenase